MTQREGIWYRDRRGHSKERETEWGIQWHRERESVNLTEVFVMNTSDCHISFRLTERWNVPCAGSENAMFLRGLRCFHMKQDVGVGNNLDLIWEIWFCLDRPGITGSLQNQWKYIYSYISGLQEVYVTFTVTEREKGGILRYKWWDCIFRNIHGYIMIAKYGTQVKNSFLPFQRFLTGGGRRGGSCFRGLTWTVLHTTCWAPHTTGR